MSLKSARSSFPADSPRRGCAVPAARPIAVVAPAVPASFSVAIDTQLWPGPSKAGTPVRALRSGTTLTPTGSARQGVFVEVSDSYGTKGWVSVEDLR